MFLYLRVNITFNYMKLLSLIIAAFFSSIAISQITINRNNLGSPGDSTYISESNSFSVDYNTTGPAQVWDFSNISKSEPRYEIVYDLSAGGYLINIQFGNFAPSQYKADMIQAYDALPLDQIAGFLPIDIPIESMNQILKSDDEKIDIVGFSISAMGQQIGFRSDTIETAYHFPSNYLDTFYSVGNTKFNLNPIIDLEIKQHRKRRTIVDGYGTITTPYNTYENALRVHHRIQEENDIKLPIGDDPFWLPINRTINEYEWWIEGYKRPVFKILTQGTLGVEVPTSITFVYDPRDPYEHLGDNLFPNPSSDFSIVHTLNELEEVEIYDLEGRLVKTIVVDSPKMHFTQIDAHNLAAGRYTVIAKTKENRVIFRYIVL